VPGCREWAAALDRHGTLNAGMEKAWECVHKLFKLFDRKQTGAARPSVPAPKPAGLPGLQPVAVEGCAPERRAQVWGRARGADMAWRAAGMLDLDQLVDYVAEVRKMDIVPVDEVRRRRMRRACVQSVRAGDQQEPWQQQVVHCGQVIG